jgi:Serine phosphatase RsbU, regulator of sigma subunit
MGLDDISRVNRLYAVLGKVNEAIIRIRAEQDLFAAACRIAVEDGGFALAWIGFVEPQTQRIRVSARYGRDEGYLDAVKISLRDDVPEGRGPTGVAMREGRPFINNDTANNPVMGPWRAEQVRRGFLSSASFPLRIAGSTIGVITLYADTTSYFDEEEVRLLTALADDFSFALEAAQVARKKAAAEEALRESHNELEARVKRRTAELAVELARTRVLMEVASQSARLLEPSELGERILEVARRQLGATSGSVCVVDHDTEVARPVASFGFQVSPRAVLRVLPPDHESLAGRAVITGRVQTLEGETARAGSVEPEATPAETRRLVAFPAKAHGRTFALITLGFAAESVFGEKEIPLYEAIGDQLGIAIENIRQFQAERDIADRLQEALLSMPHSLSEVEFAHAYHSSTEAARVGGDFYDLFALEPDHIGMSIGDVAGKGIDAAVLTSLAKHTIRAHAFEGGKTPARVISLTNEVIHEATPPDSFVTIFFAILDLRDGRLTYANAGHTTTAIVRGDGSISSLSRTGPPAGAFRGVQFGLAETRLGFGDLLFLYSDGLTEARRGAEFYGEERLFALLSNVDGGPQSVLKRVIDDVTVFSAGNFRDDLAVLALAREPSR